jgi:hypothetical protein
MSKQCSELVAIAKLNGDFQKSYGRVIGAVLYLRSIAATGGRRVIWPGLSFAVLSAMADRVARYALRWMGFE